MLSEVPATSAPLTRVLIVYVTDRFRLARPIRDNAVYGTSTMKAVGAATDPLKVTFPPETLVVVEGFTPQADLRSVGSTGARVVHDDDAGDRDWPTVIVKGPAGTTTCAK
jgi:hypothetical protein